MDWFANSNSTISWDKNILSASIPVQEDGTQDTQLSDLTNDGQISGNVVLTQTEYNALPGEKLTNGIVYMIRED